MYLENAQYYDYTKVQRNDRHIDDSYKYIHSFPENADKYIESRKRISLVNYLILRILEYMTRTKKFFYNSISTAFYQIVLMITGFITPRIMLKYYGSEINGLVSSINQFIVYFNLVEAGLSGAAIYALYKPLAENNHKAINSIVSAARKFYTQSGYIFVSLTIGLSIFYPYFVKSQILTPLNVGLLVLILGTNGALEFFTLSKYRVLLTADQKTYVISLASIVYLVIKYCYCSYFRNNASKYHLLRLVVLLSIFLRSFILMIC